MLIRHLHQSEGLDLSERQGGLGRPETRHLGMGMMMMSGSRAGGRKRRGSGKSGKGKGSNQCQQVIYSDGETPTEVFNATLPRLCPFNVEIYQPCPDPDDPASGGGITDTNTTFVYSAGAPTLYCNTNSTAGTGKGSNGGKGKGGKSALSNCFEAPAIPFAGLLGADGTYTTIGGVTWFLFEGDLGAGDMPDGPGIFILEGLSVSTTDANFTTTFSEAVGTVTDICEVLA